MKWTEVQWILEDMQLQEESQLHQQKWKLNYLLQFPFWKVYPRCGGAVPGAGRCDSSSRGAVELELTIRRRRRSPAVSCRLVVTRTRARDTTRDAWRRTRGARDMLKWLVNVAGQDGDLAADTDIHNKITEDPLATIKIGKKKKTDKVYSVNRYV